MEIIRRPRRNRNTAAIRELTQETYLIKEQLVYPLFLLPGENQRVMVDSMPGIFRLSIDSALEEIEACVLHGIHSFILFPAVPDNLKDTNATYSYQSDCFYLESIRKIKQYFPELCIITDVAMDPYSSDGHDGLVEEDEIVNDKTLPILANMAVAQAQAGADIIGPSDMMDGRIGYIRKELDKQGFHKTGIMAYTAKYASAFYGPFRDALDSAPKKGNKKTYQMNPANRREALIEGNLDFQEGADFLMVKPALAYLDVIRDFKENFNIPIVAYNVSGEYAMIKAAAKKGWLDNDKAMVEVLLSIRRAGADIIITYFAKEYASKIH
ncbi:MAG: porphobilinogen synthase [Bacteroidia bacterium]|nr:porphobilinogen synthase [Bacteroidia bacterium]